MQILLQISRLIDQFNEFIGRIVYWLALLMIGVGTWNVVGRYIGRSFGQNLSSNALIETQWYIFDVIFLLGAAYTLKHNEHVRVDVIQSRLNTKYKALVDFWGSVLFLIPFSVMVIIYSWGTISNSWKILETSPDPGGLPRYPIKSLIIVCFVLLIIQGISEAIKNFAIFKGILSPETEDPSRRSLE
ncbi:tripartite ATP-independent periplasmic transporter, DctQ family [Lyngbya aestuarii BL J]|uniref:Tripartite ATP-independent periplasmic transporter, DctQ family n=1 Tax=Lyngbya aestuarii BL J TaxID=1348334 RepID=U7QS89_9CYAN|nr:TRAP transporter small permease subunit [Lyngbya aestuarii]ERT09955.1 tripartite ATP-independent periplasmic transporter, DctQ family [Lyngbya aestuarii BL J]